ncbi:MAG: hypothetical protein ABL918_02175 [Chakrabartia sp.]
MTDKRPTSSTTSGATDIHHPIQKVQSPIKMVGQTREAIIPS